MELRGKKGINRDIYREIMENQKYKTDLWTQREEKSGTKGEGSIYTPPSVKQTAGETVRDYAGSPAGCSVTT